MSVHSRLYERLGWPAAILPQTIGTAGETAAGDAVNMENVRQLLARFAIGVNSGTVAVALQYSTSTVSSDFQAFSPAIQATGITAGSVYRQLHLDAADVPSGAAYVRAVITGSHSALLTTQVSATIITGDLRYEPPISADQLTITTVSSIDLRS